MKDLSQSLGSLETTVFEAVFVSDIHLSATDTETAELFTRFIKRLGGHCERLYILGDLFEYWLGDDDLPDPFNSAIVNALRTLSDAGCAIFFMAGNRDFLIGPDFASAAGLTLLQDPSEQLFSSGTVLLAHGDALCTDDKDYQAFRRQTQNPAWRAAVLARSLDERRALANSLRSQSESAKKQKAADIMDVNADAVSELLRQHHAPTLIHGHTHRPASHQHLVDEHTYVRRVLPDWDAAEGRWGALGIVNGRIKIIHS